MTDTSEGSEQAFTQLIASADAGVRELALRARAVVREAVPGAVEEVDPSAKLLGFTFIPGTYKGLVAAIALQNGYVNLMFSKGAELVELDAAGLLEGTGKKARHIKVRSAGRLDEPGVRTLLEAAAARTPRSA